LSSRLQQSGLVCDLAATGLEAWNRLAEHRPDLVLVDLKSPDLEILMRRLRDEYMGVTPPIVALSTGESLSAGQSEMLSAVVVRPVDPAWLTSLASEVSSGGQPLNLIRLREMLRLSTLGQELQKALENVVHRVRLVYGVNQVLLVANASERQWLATTSGQVPVSEWPRIWQIAARAVSAGAPLITTGESGAQTQLAAPLLTVNREVVGALCLVSGGVQILDGEAHDALHDLASRIGAELAWRSVHDRITRERDKLRETAMYDPLLGVFSRAALDQSLTAELARHNRNRSPLTLAVVGVAAMREINDRHGHVVGDAVLRHVASTTRDLVRAHDIVGRVGGDEIAVIMGDTDAGEARGVMARVIQVLGKRPFRAPSGVEVDIEVRAGLAEKSPGDEDPAGFLGRATEAADHAKEMEQSVLIAAGDELTHSAKREVRFEPGATLAGVYQIVHEISRGAMGVVYRAEDLGLSRPVAIKMLRPDLVREEGVVARFRQEAGTLAALSNDNLVRVYSFVEDADDVFFVMELVEGVSLHTVVNDFISRKRYLARERVAAIIEQIASALDAMHDAGVMHRDVKPSNVVLDRARDRAVLVDVGLARRLGSQSEAAGTPGYVAPESFRGGTETPATDVYGLAATAYTLLVNRAPFGNAKDVRVILRRQLEQPPKHPSTLRDDVTAETDSVLARALSTEPRDRYSTAGEFARALSESFSGINPDFDMPSVDLLPDYLMSKPDTEKQATSTDTLTFMPSMAPAPSDPSAAHSRGILFRAGAKLLKSEAGPTAIAELGDADLSEALSAQTSPGAWVSAHVFLRLLESVDLVGIERSTFAFELGALAVQLSFRRFYPSSPESLSPQGTLSATDVLWRRYNTWSGIDVEVADEREAMLALKASPVAFVCAFVRGWLTQVVIESAGEDPNVQHPSCVHRGDPTCTFVVSWRV
jgi:serine/threonine-protein kinase